ncbi:Spo0E family sporulation regulatory protein-aspartic acid phosphatase [Alkaliphilus pronyensis]|uniref:Spo0E family sporulation regulatory protein-aspartic acid phosphatase n=1 Tax=Alkaliphilus pronyensis TaxID=1482732 RepID=A0A6I0F4V1_9FIRM|nr:Spo0E family sporulation regulatory protein-aspartic acid phosphatase [Alkaliphilus pronyensis]KAB3529600.1 Spo0E family sporulation regulatory protein-aspartic acid phosphatase [Alkaliphilus pronyensis]
MTLEKLKSKLNQSITSCDDLKKDEIIKLSQELDIHIAEKQREQLKLLLNNKP